MKYKILEERGYFVIFLNIYSKIRELKWSKNKQVIWEIQILFERISFASWLGTSLWFYLHQLLALTLRLFSKGVDFLKCNSSVRFWNKSWVSYTMENIIHAIDLLSHEFSHWFLFTTIFTMFFVLLFWILISCSFWVATALTTHLEGRRKGNWS